MADAVEAVARAIAEEAYGDEGIWGEYLEEARAAIAAHDTVLKSENERLRAENEILRFRDDPMAQMKHAMKNPASPR